MNPNELESHPKRIRVREYYRFPVAKSSIDCFGCEAHAIVSIRQFHAEYRANRCHAIQARTEQNFG